MEKCVDWVHCDICDEYICPKYHEEKDDFFVVFVSDCK